jgi:hypothetical protein
MRRKSAIALAVCIFLSLSTFSFADSPAKVEVGLSKDIIYFVMPDRYKDGDTKNGNLVTTSSEMPESSEFAEVTIWLPCFAFFVVLAHFVVGCQKTATSAQCLRCSDVTALCCAIAPTSSRCRVASRSARGGLNVSVRRGDGALPAA